MSTTHFPIEKLTKLQTPFYYYDLDLLRSTLQEIAVQAPEENFHVHYALKACATPEVVREIAKAGLGADCVSGGEIKAALEAGIPADRIAFAGVGKSDWEIRLGLASDIFCFNVESVPELEVINEIAKEMGKQVRVAIRVNPNIDAHTHKYITTGLNENKFGINMQEIGAVADYCRSLSQINLIGLHFHIGSQITDMTPYQDLCIRVNEIVEELEAKGHVISSINVGGGLGINYEHPNHFPIPDFEGFFKVFRRTLKLRNDQVLHFELGRSIVAQCGSLITQVLYVKKGAAKQFAIVDAGMTDLIRPALYQATHRIDNLMKEGREVETYDIVGPICESSDVFVKDYSMPGTQRGDLLAIRSAGAYGEIMASGYNLRRLPGHYTSDNLI